MKVYVLVYSRSYTQDSYYGPNYDTSTVGVYATRELAIDAIEKCVKQLFGDSISNLDTDRYDVYRNRYGNVTVTDMDSWDKDDYSWSIVEYDLIES